MTLRTYNWMICAAVVIVVTPAAAQQIARHIRIAAQPLASALRQLASQTGTNILFQPETVRGRNARTIDGNMTPEQAARQLLQGSPLDVRVDGSGALIVSPRASVVSSSDGANDVTATADPADIVVTATKRAERLSDVPQSISVVTGERFRKEQSVRFTDYLNKIPGVNLVSFAQGDAQIVFRGLTTGASQLSSTVGIYVDEAPYGSSTIFTIAATNTPDFDPRDLDRLEVLRGPQGTLYGADSLGGVLKYVTTAPQLSDYQGRAQAGIAGVANGGTGYDLTGMLNVPIIEGKLALRVTGYGRRDPGYIDDDGRALKNINDSRVYGGRAILLWKPTDDISIKAFAIAQNLKTDNAAIKDVRYDTLKPLYGDLQLRRLINTPIDSHYRLYNGTINWNIGWAELISATSYSTLKSDSLGDLTAAYAGGVSFLLNVPVAGVELQQGIRQNKFTQEVRLQSPTGKPLEWRAGVFYTLEHGRTIQSLQAFEPGSGQVYDPRTGQPGRTDAIFSYVGPDRYREMAGFGDLTYHFSPAFDLTVGGRYSQNRQRFHSSKVGIVVGGAEDFTLPSKDDSWTYLVNPRYRITPDVIIYGRVTTGYRPGGPNLGVPASSAPRSFGPDTVTSYEIGTKGDVFDRRLSFELAAYRIDWKDIQTTQQFNNFVYVVNGPEARSQGVEASLAVRPTRGLTLSGTAAYTDAELRDDAPMSVGGFAGERLPNVPRWTTTLDAGYEWTTGDWHPFLGASYRYQGDRPSDFIATPAGPVRNRTVIPAYSTVDLRAGISNDRWSFNLYAKNVTDKRAILGISPLVNVPDPVYLPTIPFSAGILQPRTVGAALTINF